MNHIQHMHSPVFIDISEVNLCQLGTEQELCAERLNSCSMIEIISFLIRYSKHKSI